MIANLENIIFQFLSGSLDEVSKAALLKEITQHKEAEKLFYEMKLAWDISDHSFDANSADTENELKRFSEKIAMESQESVRLNRGFRISKFFKYAAVFIVGFGIAYGLITLTKQQSVSEVSQFNEIIVPKGEKSQVILSDGTKIWLNSDSKLKYPSKFVNNKRTVFLEGEAYFEVTKDKHAPFIVNTQNLDIKVLGTSFNVKSYQDDKTAEATVIEGKVYVQKSVTGNNSSEPLILNPNQKATFNKTNQSLVVSNLDVSKKESKESIKITPQKKIISTPSEAVVSWKEQVLYFDNESLEEMIVKLERWYGFDIEVKNPELLKNRYKGKFENYETIYQVLDAIRLTTPLKYRVNEKKIILEKL